MTASFDLSELAELVANVERAAAADIAFPLAAGLADVWVDYSQAHVPVDTGQTKARTAVQSVTSSGARAHAEVISDTPYAGYIDQGTSRTPPRPYFRGGRDAAADAARELGGQVGTSIERMIVSGGVWNPRGLM
jgi:hypothetical protein